MPKRRKALRAAVDTALSRVCGDLQQQFPEFTANEITRAVFVSAPKRREQEARRKAKEAEMAEWLKNYVPSKPCPTVNDPAEVERLRQIREQHLKAAEDRANEQKHKQALARKIIDAGYKAVAKQLHPDIGGDTDAMSRSNEIRNRLKQVYG